MDGFACLVGWLVCLFACLVDSALSVVCDRLFCVLFRFVNVVLVCLFVLVC